jgi:hypothetical protein
MRPGVTGWAAVRGRHTLAFEDRLELDAWYVEHWTLGLDLRIIAMTLRQVLGRSGVRDTQDMAEISFPARFAEGLAAGVPAQSTTADPPVTADTGSPSGASDTTAAR